MQTPTILHEYIEQRSRGPELPMPLRREVGKLARKGFRVCGITVVKVEGEEAEWLHTVVLWKGDADEV